MKSLQESLFDKDLVNKDISFFNYYDWEWSSIFISYKYGCQDSKYKGCNRLPIETACKSFLNYKDVVNTKVVNKLPRHIETLVSKGEDNVFNRQVYNDLSKYSIEQIPDKNMFAQVVADALKKVINNYTGNMVNSAIWPSGKSNALLVEDDIKSVRCEVKNFLDIDDCMFQLNYILDLKRKK